jgi:hypothetical protein
MPVREQCRDRDIAELDHVPIIEYPIDFCRLELELLIFSVGMNSSG